MTAPKRTEVQREIDLAEMAKLLRRGWTQARIAEKFGVTQQQISYDWKILLARLREAEQADTAAKKAVKLEQYREVASEAWEAWERSKENKERTTAEKTSGGEGGEARTKAVKTTEGRLPDHNYLKVVTHCLDQECKLDGLVTDKIEYTGSSELVIIEEVVDGNQPKDSPPAPGAESLPPQ